MAWNGAKTPDVVLLDCDGTIFDTESLYLEAWRSQLCRPNEISIDHIRGKRQEEVFLDIREYLKDPLASPEQVFEDKQRKYLNLRERGVPLIAGARDLMSSLANHGVRMAVVSSSAIQDLRYLFAQAKLDSLVAVYVGYGETKPKPAPDPWLLAMEKLEVSPPNCVAVEDSQGGVESVVEAGLHVFWLGGPTESLPPLVTAVNSLQSVQSLLLWPSSPMPGKDKLPSQTG